MDKNELKKVVKTGRILHCTPDTKLLLTCGEYGDLYQTPGGWCEEGETSLEAAIREYKEETGLTIMPNQLEYRFSISTTRAAKTSEKGFDLLQKEEDFYLFLDQVSMATAKVEGNTASFSAFPVVSSIRFVPLETVTAPEFPLFPPLLKDYLAQLHL